MVKILPPYKPDISATEPGLRLSVAPSPHARFTNDVGYYDNLGRDPMQMFHVYLVKDPEARVARLKEIWHEFEGSRHRRHMLMDCASRGDEALVRCLVETGIKIHPDIPGQNGIPEKDSDAEEDDLEDFDLDDPMHTPLQLAAWHGQLSCLKIILEEGKLDVDIRDKFGRTALHCAAQAGHADIVQYLLEQGANPTLRLATDEATKKIFGEMAGCSALEFSAGHSTPAAAKLLLEHPIHGTMRPRKYNSSAEGVYVSPLAIQSAVNRGSYETVRFLLERGSYPLHDIEGTTKGEQLDPTQRKTIEDSVADAIEYADYQSIELILSYLYPANSEGQVQHFVVPEELKKPITWGAYNAAKTDDVKKFKWLYDFKITQHDEMSLDPLPPGQHLNIQHLFDTAASAGSVNCMKLLIEKYGAKPDVYRMPFGVSTVYTAAMYNKPGSVRYLLENHDINIHHGSGAFATGPTALCAAIVAKCFDAIEVLLKHGGPVDEVDQKLLNSKTNAVLLAEQGKRAPVRLLAEDDERAQKVIKEAQKDWLHGWNPRYVRLELGPEDRHWISQLQPRWPDEQLAEHGKMARRLNEDDNKEDPVPGLFTLPVDETRDDSLQGDPDLAPAWRPLFVAR